MPCYGSECVLCSKGCNGQNREGKHDQLASYGDTDRKKGERKRRG